MSHGAISFHSEDADPGIEQAIVLRRTNSIKLDKKIPIIRGECGVPSEQYRPSLSALPKPTVDAPSFRQVEPASGGTLWMLRIRVETDVMWAQVSGSSGHEDTSNDAPAHTLWPRAIWHLTI